MMSLCKYINLVIEKYFFLSLGKNFFGTTTHKFLIFYYFNIFYTLCGIYHIKYYLYAHILFYT